MRVSHLYRLFKVDFPTRTGISYLHVIHMCSLTPQIHAAVFVFELLKSYTNITKNGGPSDIIANKCYSVLAE